MATQLIPVFSSTLSNEPSLLCNARDLHAFLEVGKRFASWITERINEYEFVENQDYIIASQIREANIRGGHNRKDYHLTLDTAKELAMVERNEKGRQIRRYFIECEKELRQVKTTSTEQRLPLRDAVKMLVRKKSIRYEDAYRLIHQRFSVGHIDEIEEAQLPVAIEYIHRLVLEGELIGKQASGTLSAKEANSLVWLWDYANRSQALFRELYPAMKLIHSDYSGRCYDHAREFSHIIGIARDDLLAYTRDADFNEPGGPTNLSAWERLRNRELPPVHLY